MQGSKDYMKAKGIYAKISFKDNKPHTFELVKDKVETMHTSDGDKEGVKYLVKEDGELRSFFTTSESLISKLSTYNEGDVITVQLVSKNIGGQYKSVYEIKGKGSVVEAPEWDEPEIG